MDPKEAHKVYKLLKKQYELTQQARDKTAQELHRLQVEEEVLMRQLYDQISNNRPKEDLARICNQNDKEDGNCIGLLKSTSEDKQ